MFKYLYMQPRLAVRILSFLFTELSLCKEVTHARNDVDFFKILHMAKILYKLNFVFDWNLYKMINFWVSLTKNRPFAENCEKNILTGCLSCSEVDLLKSRSISELQLLRCLNNLCFTAGSINTEFDDFKEPFFRDLEESPHKCNSGVSRNRVTC